MIFSYMAVVFSLILFANLSNESLLSNIELSETPCSNLTWREQKETLDILRLRGGASERSTRYSEVLRFSPAGSKAHLDPWL